MKKRIMAVLLITALIITSLSTFTVFAADGGDSCIAPLAEYPTYYTTSAVKMRTGAGTNYSEILTIPCGAQVEVGSFADWYYVYYNGYSGYVIKDFLVPASSVYSVTATSGLNLRSSPSNSGSVIATLSTGTRVYKISTTSGWYYVKVISGAAQGSTGYVSPTYLKNMG